MNCTEAKKIPIVSYLAACGITPEKVRGDEVLYKSPLREDHRPSFFVNRKKNTWYDARGFGGNILDLVMRMNMVTLPGALMILQRPGISAETFSFPCQQTEAGSIELKHVQQLQNRALVQYIEGRGIPAKVAACYCHEAYYRIDGKQYFALAFCNDQLGFELRNKYFKGSIAPKAITTIKGKHESVIIFEGFINFLSALVYYKKTRTEATIIILNSVSNLHLALPKLQTFRNINLFFDNDKAGEQATIEVKELYPDATDFSKIVYPGYNDFNEYLTRKK